jgi:hypothetical protein
MVRVRFVNGVERVLLFQEKDGVLLWLGEAEALVTREEAEISGIFARWLTLPQMGRTTFLLLT